jgi:hypothetical protein
MKNVEGTITTTDQNPTVAEQSASATPRKPASKKKASVKKAAPKSQKPAKDKAKTAKPAAAKDTKAKRPAKAAPAKEPGTLRPDSKGAQALALISRPKGASLAEIMKATGWQAHSVRGLISGTLGKKLGIKINSAKREDGERVYSLSK